MPEYDFPTGDDVVYDTLRDLVDEYGYEAVRAALDGLEDEEKYERKFDNREVPTRVTRRKK